MYNNEFENNKFYEDNINKEEQSNGIIKDNDFQTEIIEENEIRDNKKNGLKKKKNKKIILIITIILFILLLIGLYFIFGFSNKTKDKKVKTKKKIVKEEKINVVDLNSKTRPYAVMINNNQAVWGYQAGIQDAYITYEIVVEGGITRLMALFKDKTTEKIASVRSSRHYYLDYVLENDAIYAHIGWSPQAQNDISSLGINNINADNSNAFTWDNTLRMIATEHRAYTTIEKLKESATNKGYRMQTDSKLLLKYQAKSIDFEKYQDKILANKVTIPYSSSQITSYEYDSENKVYKRFQNGKEHKDYVTGMQYTAKNIIAYSVYNYPLNDGSGKDRQGLNNVGSGEGYFISEANAVPITWEKTSRSEKTIYKVKETGKELVVNDGNTFIQIYPTTKNITIE